jgi:hypothetical protein
VPKAHLVPFQLLFPEAVEKVAVTDAATGLPGATVGLEAPFKVAELMIQLLAAADAGTTCRRVIAKKASTVVRRRA